MARDAKDPPTRVTRDYTPGRKQTFSYYSSRSPQPMRRQSVRTSNSVNKQSRGTSSSLVSSQQFVRVALIGLATVFVLFQLILLSPNSTIRVVLNDSPTTLNQKDTLIYKHEVDALLKESLLNRTKITLNSKGIATALQAKHPELRDVLIVPPVIGTSPIVSVTPSQPVAKLNVLGQTYSIDQNGYIVAMATSSKHLPLITDESSTAPQVGKQFLPGTTVTAVLQINQQFAVAGRNIEAYVLPAANLYELVVRPSESNYIIRFNLKSDIVQQSGAALATIQHLGSNQPKEYLDVRVQGRAYFK